MKGLIASLMLMLAFSVVPATAARNTETVRVQINKQTKAVCEEHAVDQIC